MVGLAIRVGDDASGDSTTPVPYVNPIPSVPLRRPHWPCLTRAVSHALDGEGADGADRHQMVAALEEGVSS